MADDGRSRPTKLVIGASGFLGSHVTRRLIAEGEDVRVMLRRFAYVEPAASGPATVYELMELTDVTRGMGTFVRDAATDWDGADPIRVIEV